MSSTVCTDTCATNEPVLWTSEGDISVDFAASTASSSSSTLHAEQSRARWSPYDFNGGTVLAISGDDYVVLAGDTRLSTGYSILSRKESKVSRLTPYTLMASPGSYNDILQLRGVLQIQAKIYEQENEKIISTASLAQLLSNTLYQRRFFPYYAFNLLVGLDEEGKGAVYTYDAVGSYQRLSRGAMGSGAQLMIPLLDNLVEHEMRNDPKIKFSVKETVEIMKDAFITAGERDIYTGDSVEIYIVTKEGIQKEMFELKKD